MLASTTVNSSNETAVSRSASGNVVLYAGIPLLLLLLVVCAVLVVIFLWMLIKKRHLKQTSSHRAVPKDDSLAELSRGLSKISIPYPPRVQITAPVNQPDGTINYPTSFSHQYQLDATKYKTRYPFTQHAAPSPEASKEDKRNPRLRTRRKGNHKHQRGRHVVTRKKSKDYDQSPTATETGDTSRDHSPLPPMGQSQPQEYMMQVRRSSEDPPSSALEGRDPEISITVQYVGRDLKLHIGQVKGLPLRDDGSQVDGYIRVYLTPVIPSRPARPTSRTHTERHSSSPVFEEEIAYEDMTLEEVRVTTLHVEALDFKSYGKHTLLGCAEIALGSLNIQIEPVNMKLQLRPPPEVKNFNGTVLISLCFEPDQRKLSVIILRAKDLNKNVADETDPFAKVSISLKDRVLSKLKTKKKVGSCSPIFNEALSCTVGMENINWINITVTLINDSKDAIDRELGMIVLGSNSTGEELRHWNEVITSPGKHIAEWHNLCYNQ